MTSALTLSSVSSWPELDMARSRVSPQSLPSSSGEDFGTVMKGLMNAGAETLRQGEASAIEGIKGTLPIQDVVERVMEAERSLQTAIAFRDKLVSSYLEISRMQI
jgi:flagellar hook-basal body complex protein FliE